MDKRLLIRRCVAAAIIIFLVVSCIFIFKADYEMMQKVVYVIGSACVGAWIWKYFWKDPYKE